MKSEARMPIAGVLRRFAALLVVLILPTLSRAQGNAYQPQLLTGVGTPSGATATCAVYQQYLDTATGNYYSCKPDQTGQHGSWVTVGSTGAINGLAYTSFAGKLLWSCSWSSGSSTITCPSGTFTAASVGLDAFATSLAPLGGTSFSTSVFTCGSAGTRTTIATFIDSAHVNLSANCTANSGASNPFFFGPDETTGLGNLATALNNACGAGIIPQGWALIKSATFVDPPQTACTNPIGGSRQGPDLFGPGPGEGQFIIAPDFNWASCQGHGQTGRACFFGAAGPANTGGGYSVRYLGINGLGGQYTNPAQLTYLTEFDCNTYADHVNIVGVGGRTGNIVGVQASCYPTDLNFVQADSVGFIACRIGSTIGAITMEHSYCGDTNCSTTFGGSLDIVGYLNSTQNIYGPCWTNSTYEVNQAAGAQTFTSDQDEYIDNSGGTSVVFLGNNGTGTMRLHSAKILPTAASDIGIYIGTSGAQVALDHSTVKTTGTSSKAFQTVAGTTLSDDGGNTFITVAANILGGTYQQVVDNPMTVLGDVTYGGTVTNGLAATTRLAGPIATNGVPQTLTSTPSGGVAVAPVWAPAGVPTNAQTGTTYTVAATDRTSYVTFSNAGAIAVTLPQAGTTGFASNFSFVACAIGTGTATITPTTSTISFSTGAAYTAAAASMTLTTGQCAFVYSDNTNYFAIRR